MNLALTMVQGSGLEFVNLELNAQTLIRDAWASYNSGQETAEDGTSSDYFSGLQMPDDLHDR